MSQKGTFDYIEARHLYWAYLDEGVSDDLSLLLWVGGHVQGLADALARRAVLVRDGQGRRPVVEGVRRVHKWRKKKKR